MYEDLNYIRVEKDLGVNIDQYISFKEHFAEKINKGSRMVGLIRRTFTALDEEMFKSLHVTLVRPHLEYAIQVWCPSNMIERV